MDRGIVNSKEVLELCICMSQSTEYDLFWLKNMPEKARKVSSIDNNFTWPDLARQLAE